MLLTAHSLPPPCTVTNALHVREQQALLLAFGEIQAEKKSLVFSALVRITSCVSIVSTTSDRH